VIAGEGAPVVAVEGGAVFSVTRNHGVQAT